MNPTIRLALMSLSLLGVLLFEAIQLGQYLKKAYELSEVRATLLAVITAILIYLPGLGLIIWGSVRAKEVSIGLALGWIILGYLGMKFYRKMKKVNTS